MLVEALRAAADDCPDCVLVERPGLHPQLVLCAGCEAEDAADQLRRDQEAREEAMLAVADDRWRASGVPAHLADWSFDRVDKVPRDGAAFRAARAFAAGTASGVMLTGEVGSGKSTLAAAAARERCRRERVLWVSPSFVNRALRGGWDAPERQLLLGLPDDPRAVVLDDLGNALDAPNAVSVLYHVLDDRLQGAAPILITSNLAPADLAETFGGFAQALKSRMQLLVRAQLGGSDLRRRR